MTHEIGKDKQAARTTIVGGQPPGNVRALDGVPNGIEQLLGMAAADEALAAQLKEDRHAVIAGSGLQLSATERAVLAAIDDATLARMIAKVGEKLADPERRELLALGAQAMALLAGGAVLASGFAACDNEVEVKVAGSRPDRPPAPTPKPAGERPDRPLPPTGSRPDRPTPPLPPASQPRESAGARADRPPTIVQKQAGVTATRPIGGLTADTQDDDKEQKPKKPKKPTHPPGRTRGIRPDRPRPTRGIRPDRPGKDPFEE